MIVSVSGFDQEVYEINHANGDIAYVKDNLQLAAAFKANGVASGRIVLRFIKFPYNHAEERKLEKFANELGIEFEVITGVGDPTARPVGATNTDYENMLRSYRSERPYDQPGKVCPLIFGAGTAIDHNGTAYLCCAHPNYDALQIGSYLDLPQEEILLRRYHHPICGSCNFPRREATPADNEALLEALRFRLDKTSRQPAKLPEPV